MGAKFFCENCGALVDASERKCPSCGLTFNGVRCPECGFIGEQRDFSSGCPSCGYLKPQSRGTGTRPGLPSAGTPQRVREEIPPRRMRETTRPKRDRKESRQLPQWAYLLILVCLVGIILVLLLLYHAL